MDQRTYKECDEGIGILLVNNFLQLPDFILVHGTEKDLLRVVGVRTVILLIFYLKNDAGPAPLFIQYVIKDPGTKRLQTT